MKITEFDTIVGPATSFLDAGIGIIRMSGDNSFGIIDKIFTPFNENKKGKKAKEYKTHTLTYGVIKDGDEIIDEVLVTIMKSPNTYTREDIAEINCHGGKISLSRILQIVIKNGARIAQNGEFTKRAFLNGRIDLSKAEAVIDIINAKTTISHKMAVGRLKGQLYDKIKALRDEILTITAHIEVAIDYPEHDEELITYNMVGDKTRALIIKIEDMLKKADIGKILQEGIKAVILGRPNVGKSSILNMILDEERAIVSDIEGTTRDVLKENININGIHLNIMDTAGIRKSEDHIEKIGVSKSKEYAKNADLILLVFDGSKDLSDEDINLLNFTKDKKVIAIINKVDLKSKINLEKITEYIPKENIIKMSTKELTGFEYLCEKIQNLFLSGDINIESDILITTERNKGSLQNSIISLKSVINTVENKMPEDFVSMDLLDAYGYLGEIIGESLGEDVLDAIFSNFCLGK